MTLAIRDHLVIKREGKILTPEVEAYHEFEVVEQSIGYQTNVTETVITSNGQPGLLLKVVK